MALVLLAGDTWRVAGRFCCPQAHCERYSMLANHRDGCRAAARAVGYAIARGIATTAEPPRSVRPPQGDCAVVRFHLLVDARATDSMDIER